MDTAGARRLIHSSPKLPEQAGSRSTSANSVVLTFVWMSRLPSTRMFSLIATKASRTLARVSMNDQAVAALEDACQLVEAPALLGGLPGGGRFDELVDAAELFGQNVRLFLTEPCRSPTPTFPAPA